MDSHAADWSDYIFMKIYRPLSVYFPKNVSLEIVCQLILYFAYKVLVVAYFKLLKKSVHLKL